MAFTTLLLDTLAWDLVLDANGNIAVASAPYALAQDAASAIRLFQGELWYDTSQGIPYFTQILGQLPPINYIKQTFINAALTVPGVASAEVFLSGINTVARQITGQVQISTDDGQTAVVNF